MEPVPRANARKAPGCMRRPGAEPERSANTCARLESATARARSLSPCSTRVSTYCWYSRISRVRNGSLNSVRLKSARVCSTMLTAASKWRAGSAARRPPRRAPPIAPPRRDARGVQNVVEQGVQPLGRLQPHGLVIENGGLVPVFQIDVYGCQVAGPHRGFGDPFEFVRNPQRTLQVGDGRLRVSLLQIGVAGLHQSPRQKIPGAGLLVAIDAGPVDLNGAVILSQLREAGGEIALRHRIKDARSRSRQPRRLFEISRRLVEPVPFHPDLSQIQRHSRFAKSRMQGPGTP